MQIAFEANVPPMALVRYVIEPLPDNAPQSHMAHVSCLQILNAIGEQSDRKVPQFFRSHTSHRGGAKTAATRSSDEAISLTNSVYDLRFDSGTGELKVLYAAKAEASHFTHHIKLWHFRVHSLVISESIISTLFIRFQ